MDIELSEENFTRDESSSVGKWLEDLDHARDSDERKRDSHRHKGG